MVVAATALLLGACASAPFFSAEETGVCVAAYTQTGAQECVCSECLEWDAPPRAERYEITRRTVSTGAEILAGVTYTPGLWCFAWDASFPRQGTRYRYTVRACNAYGCSPESVPVFYVGAPYACFDGGREVACYVGDAVVTR